MAEIWVMGENYPSTSSEIGLIYPWNTSKLGTRILGMMYSFVYDPDTVYTGFEVSDDGTKLFAYTPGDNNSIQIATQKKIVGVTKYFKFTKDVYRVITVKDHDNDAGSPYAWLTNGGGCGIQHDFAVNLKTFNPTWYNDMSNGTWKTKITAKGHNYADSDEGTSVWLKS